MLNRTGLLPLPIQSRDSVPRICHMQMMMFSLCSRHRHLFHTWATLSFISKSGPCMKQVPVPRGLILIRTSTRLHMCWALLRSDTHLLQSDTMLYEKARHFSNAKHLDSKSTLQLTSTQRNNTLLKSSASQFKKRRISTKKQRISTQKRHTSSQ